MNIKPIAIILIIIGIVMISYTSFNYFTTEKIVDLGAIEITKKQNHPFYWSPFVGVAVLVGGIILMFSSRKQ
jgi:uncharacterized membrane protein YidH (DUF202 family)